MNLGSIGSPPRHAERHHTVATQCRTAAETVVADDECGQPARLVPVFCQIVAYQGLVAVADVVVLHHHKSPP